MKKILLLVLLLFLVSCNQVTQTESTTTTELETSSNTEDLESRFLTLSENQSGLIELSSVEGAIAYTLYVSDVTDIDEELLLADQEFSISVTELSFNTSVLQENRLYSIYALTVFDTEEEVIRSNTLNLDLFTDLGSLEITYNINNLDNLYIPLQQEITDLLYIEGLGHKFLANDYLLYDNYLLIEPQFFHNNFSLRFDYELDIFTETGKYNLTVVSEENNKPSILTANEVVFDGSDLIFVFDYCGGQLEDINGTELSANDFSLDNNILTIDSSFIQGLFDAEAERDTVILNYQLRNDTDIVIGYLFINRNE